MKPTHACTNHIDGPLLSLGIRSKTLAIFDSINQPDEEKRPLSFESMFSEYFREASVLVLVFALLDKLIGPEGLTLDWILGTILVSFLLLLAGMIIERSQ